MASVGFRPLGQTLTQFMMPRQRNTLKGSSKSVRRSSVAVSRLSARKRYACKRPAGPTNLSGFHQNDGHAVEQQAQRMHSYRPFSFSRSSGDCRRSPRRGRIVVHQPRFDAFVLAVELRHVHHEIANHRQQPGSGRSVSLPRGATSATGVVQARPFLPFMLMPSEPQTPSRHERR